MNFFEIEKCSFVSATVPKICSPENDEVIYLFSF